MKLSEHILSLCIALIFLFIDDQSQALQIASDYYMYPRMHQNSKHTTK